jgi:hypothetical protein
MAEEAAPASTSHGTQAYDDGAEQRSLWEQLASAVGLSTILGPLGKSDGKTAGNLRHSVTVCLLFCLHVYHIV